LLSFSLTKSFKGNENDAHATNSLQIRFCVFTNARLACRERSTMSDVYAYGFSFVFRELRLRVLVILPFSSTIQNLCSSMEPLLHHSKGRAFNPANDAATANFKEANAGRIVYAYSMILRPYPG
jgi:hypothetical protein